MTHWEKKKKMHTKLPLMAAVLLIIGLLATKTAKATTSQIALPGCADKCGDVEIPYPFGVGDEKCFLDAGFKLACDGDSKLWTTQFRNEDLPTTQSQITRIDPVKGTMEILMPVSRLCFHPICRTVADKQPLLGVEPPTFRVSGDENKFFAVGCNTYSILYGSEFSNGSLSPVDRDGYWTGCTSICGHEIADHVRKCSGIGCCNINVPAGRRRIQTRAISFGERAWGYNNNSCSYAFVAKNGWFRASVDDLKNLRFESSVLVIDWAVGKENQTCGSDRRMICRRRKNTECVDTKTRSGYRCRCRDGYGGNPYLPSGCQRIPLT